MVTITLPSFCRLSLSIVAETLETVSYAADLSSLSAHDRLVFTLKVNAAGGSVR